MALLELHSVSKSFGGVKAVDDLSFSVEGGETVGLFGGNGSGKTTTLNLINKTISLSDGKIFFKGERIDQLPAFKIARLGIGRIFQTGGLFPNMTAMENLTIALENRYGHKAAAEEREKAEKILHHLGLHEKADKKAGSLSGGQQKLLEFGRVMLRNDELILLDEPFAGVSQANTKKIEAVIRELQKAGKSMIIIEHDLPRIKRLCDRVIELEKGQKVKEIRTRGS